MCVRAYVRACVCVCVCACVRACGWACVCVHISTNTSSGLTAQSQWDAEVRTHKRQIALFDLHFLFSLCVNVFFPLSALLHILSVGKKQVLASSVQPQP